MTFDFIFDNFWISVDHIYSYHSMSSALFLIHSGTSPFFFNSCYDNIADRRPKFKFLESALKST